MGKIQHLDSTGEILEHLMQKQLKGQLKGIVAAILTEDGFEVLLDERLDYVSCLGLLEAAKADRIARAMEVI